MKEELIKHFVTDRHSTGPGQDEFTLSYSSSPDKNKISGNRKALATALGVEDTHLYFPSQVHSTRIVHVTSDTPVEGLMETDALITSGKAICISVMSADCVPILLLDRKNKAVAAIHSGWRGTVARVVEKTLAAMRDTFGTAGEDLVAGIGPSVSRESYEVGAEVIQAVEGAFSNANDLMVMHGGRAKLDLWKANEVQLLEFGVPPSNIEISGLCTVINNNYFFSARKGDSGRFSAGIMLV